MTEQRTIDLTPRWADAMQIYIAALEHGTGAGRDAAREELHRVAKILDQLADENAANADPTVGTTATIYEVLVEGDKGPPFGQTFATFDQAQEYTDKMELAGYTDAGSCCIAVLTDVNAAIENALDFFHGSDDLDRTQAPAHINESAKL